MRQTNINSRGVLAGALLVGLSLVVAVVPLTAQAGDLIDLDLWHEDLIEALGEEPGETTEQRPAFGIYPTLGGSIGPPTWISAQGHAYLSFTEGKSFSIYAGYCFWLYLSRGVAA